MRHGLFRLGFPCIILLIPILGSPVFAEDLLGEIQVTANAGYIVYLDGEEVGKTSTEDGGLFVDAVPVGEHLLQYELQKIKSCVVQVNVKSNATTEVEINEFSNNYSDNWWNNGTGLIIKTKPLKATVSLNGILFKKDVDLLRVDAPVGKYEIVITSASKVQKIGVELQRGEQRVVVADFQKGTIESYYSILMGFTTDDSGLVVEKVSSSSVLADRLLPGDRLALLNGERTPTESVWEELKSRIKPNTKNTLSVVRDYEVHELEFTPIARELPTLVKLFPDIYDDYSNN